VSNSILVVILSSILFCFVIGYFVVLTKLVSTKRSLGKLYVDNFALEEYIKTLKNIKEDKSDQQIHQENFLKFLSDSRDWAFDYIEEVQNGITKFVSDIEPEINYFNEYGDIASMSPNYYSLKKISEAYEELKKLLPEEQVDEK